MATPNLNITEVTANQTQKEVTINDAITALDNAGNSTVDKSMTAGNVLLTSAEFRGYVRFNATGTPGTARTLSFPASIKRLVGVTNNSDSQVTVQVTGAPGTTVVLVPGAKSLVYVDGTNVISLGGGAGPGDPIDFGFYIGGGVTDEDRTWTFVAVRAFQLPASLTLSKAYAATPQTTGSNMDLDVYKNGVSVGTIRFATTANTASFIAASATSFAAGDRLSIHTPVSLQALAGISITLAGSKL